ncbi:MAG: sulfatase-like hydrolase/transferase [Luteolibacter sp.]
MKKTHQLVATVLASCLSAHAANIGIDSNWTVAANFAAFTESVVSDSTVTLTASTNGQVSSTSSDGTEWDIRQGLPGNVATSEATAISLGSYIEFNIDSTGTAAGFAFDSFTLSFARNGAQTANNFQLAYSADDTWDTSDLLGTVTTDITTNTITLTASAADLPDSVSRAKIRLYHWDNYIDGNPNHPNATANFHLLGVSAEYTAYARPTGEKPNVVLIFMDDMGYNDIGVQTFPSTTDYYPNSGPSPKPGYAEPDIPDPNEARLLTPRIDTLAQDGMRMTSFHTARLCSPSRASLMTGRYASRMNMDRVFQPNSTTGFSTEEVTLPEMLRENGYQTGMVGKWHLGYNASETLSFQMMPTRAGFQEFFGMPYSNDQGNYRLIQNENVVKSLGQNEADQNGLTWELTEAALDYMERASAKDAPFFLYFAQIMTHTPCYASNQEYQNADGTTWPIFKGTSGVSYYYDVMKETDHSVGRVLDKLEDLGIADNTIVIFTSDNGPWLNHATYSGRVIDLLDSSVGSAYPLKDGKFTTWEGGTRTPFLVRWPDKISAGTTSGALTGVIDLAPTLMTLAGGKMPDDRTIDGLDIWPIWSGQLASMDRKYAVFNDGAAQGVLKGNWKLRSSLLYDLDTDIQEETDVSGNAANSEMFDELRAFRDSIASSAASDVIPLGTFTSYEVEFSDNDITVPEGGTATVDIRLSHDPGSSVTVTTSHFSGDSDLSVTSGDSLVFNSSNWSDWQTVSLSAAVDVDNAHSGATFRTTMSAQTVVRELFVFEDDSEAPDKAVSSLVWPKALSLNLTDETTKLVAEASAQIGALADPAGTIYGWRKVSGPGTVTFTDPTAKLTGVSFSATGTYELRLITDHASAGAFDAVNFTVNVGGSANAVLGDYKYAPVLAYDASSFTTGDSTWGNDVTANFRNWSVASAVNKTTSDPAAQLSFIDAALNFPGSGALPIAATSDDFDAYGNGDASFEFWFKPTTLPTSTAELLWETGGDIGVAFVLDGNLLRFAVDDGGSNVVNGAIAEATLSPAASQDGFVHCIGVIDLTNNQIKLYIDGSLIDTEAIASVSDWCGTSETGLGTIADSSGNEVATTSHLGANDLLTGSYNLYAGMVAHILFYDKALTAVEVTDLATGPRQASTLSNIAPVVSAGSDQSVAYTAGAALSGTASDDGLPAASSLTTLWRLSEGPAAPTFGDANALSTQADFSLPGAHTLWLEADDGEIKVYDESIITVAAITYAEWASGITFPAGESDLSDNPDNDGRNNAWEWLLDSDPLISDAGLGFMNNIQPNGSDEVSFTFEFVLPRNRQPNLLLEGSETLSNDWDELNAIVPTIEILDETSERWVFDLFIDSDEQPKYFIRPKVSP